MMMWAEGWNYRRKFGLTDEELWVRKRRILKYDLTKLQFVYADVHITEIDGITPLKSTSKVIVDDKGIIQGIEKDTEPNRDDGFCVYYMKSFQTPLDSALGGTPPWWIVEEVEA